MRILAVAAALGLATGLLADFGRINRNTVAQSNFQRFVQLGFRFIF